MMKLALKTKQKNQKIGIITEEESEIEMIGKGLSKTMQGNEEAITKMIRNYDKLNNDTRKKWRVTNYHKKNNKINILLQAIEYERKHCEVEEHQYKQCVKMEGVTLITKKAMTESKWIKS